MEPKIITLRGKSCQFEGCSAPATAIASGRSVKHPVDVRVYCDEHANVVANDCISGKPEYIAACQNCGCLEGIN